MANDPAVRPAPIGEETPLPFYMQGNFAPVANEVTAFDLEVEGAVPPDLCGLFVRNGPNPKNGDPGHWFLGDGMLHGVRLEGGRARWYRNRWVRTRCFEEDAQFLRDDASVDRTAAKANTSVIGHAGRILALVENAFPTEVTGELETTGIHDFGGRLTTAMTAHPKLCPRTGELHFFGYHFLPPFLTYHRVDRDGALTYSAEIPVPGPTMMHDFAITDRHVIFMDLPVVFDFDLALSGAFPYRWSDDYGARLGVMPRDGNADAIRWYEIEPCYVFHPLNAYDDGNAVVVDVARYRDLWRAGANQFAPAAAHRWVIDLERGTVAESPVDDRAIEFPRIDDRLTGRRHRYGYAVSNHAGVSEQPAVLLKYDLDRGEVRQHDLGPGHSPAEAVFVPSSGRSGEDEGFLLSFVYDAAVDRSELVILDANSFTSPPVARVKLPQRVPFGFHGNWIGDVG